MSTTSTTEPGPYATAHEHGLMEGFPPPPERRVTRANWFFAPYNRWGFSHFPELIPTAEVSRGTGPVRELPARLADDAVVDALEAIDHDGVTRTLPDLLERTYTDGMVVLRDGERVFERYLNGLTPSTRHLCASATKSFTGLLALLAVDEGLLDPTRPVVDYLPELAGSGFDDATVLHVLDMTVSVEWDELSWLEHEASPDAEEALFIRFLRATGSWVDASDDRTTGVWDFVTQLRRDHTREHGDRFMYLTPATDVLGWLVTRAYQRPFVDVLAERIWSRIGAERSGLMALDPSGTPVASGGLNVTLPDLARFGQMLLDGGRVDGDQVVPAPVVDDICAGGSREAFARSPDVGHMEGWSYRAQWWVAPDGQPTAWGVCGQILWIDPARRVVIARFASAPDAIDPKRDEDETAICELLAAHFG